MATEPSLPVPLPSESVLINPFQHLIIVRCHHIPLRNITLIKCFPSTQSPWLLNSLPTLWRVQNIITPMATLPDEGLPQELVDQVIDHLWDDKRSLGACSLVRSSWFPEARFHLFRKITLDFSHQSARELYLFIGILCSRTQEMNIGGLRMTLEELTMLVSKMPMLQCIHLFKLHLETEKDPIIPACPSVREIVLDEIFTHPSYLFSPLFLAFPNARNIRYYPGTFVNPQTTLPTEFSLEYLEVHYDVWPFPLLNDLHLTASKNTLRGLGLNASPQCLPVLQRFPLEMRSNINYLRLELHARMKIREYVRVVPSIFSTFPDLKHIALVFRMTSQFLTSLEGQLDTLGALPKDLRSLTIECDVDSNQDSLSACSVMWKELDSVIHRCSALKSVRCLKHHPGLHSTCAFSVDIQQYIRGLLPTLNASGLLRFN